MSKKGGGEEEEKEEGEEEEVDGRSFAVWLRVGIQKNSFFFGYLSQMWVGGVADSQTRSKPLKKKTKLPRKSPFSTQISPFVFPNLTKTLGWVNRFGKGFPPKKTFFLYLPFTI